MTPYGYGDNDCIICGKDVYSDSMLCVECRAGHGDNIPGDVLQRLIWNQSQMSTEKRVPSDLETRRESAPAKANSISADAPERSKDLRFWRLNCATSSR